MSDHSSSWLCFNARWKKDCSFPIQDWVVVFQEVDATSRLWELYLKQPGGCILQGDDSIWPWSLHLHLRMKLNKNYVLDKEIILNNANPRPQFVFPDVENLEGLNLELKLKSIEGLSMIYPSGYDIATDLTDVILCINDEKVYQSKATLASKSGYFKSMFFGEFAECNKKEVQLKDVDCGCFLNFLDVLHYGSRMIISFGRAEQVLKLSSYFQAPCAADSVEEWLVKNFKPKKFKMDHLLLANKYLLRRYTKLILDNLNITQTKHLFTAEIFKELSPEVTAVIWKKLSNSK